MEIIIKVVQLILSLSLLVVVHEFGHFLFARIFKIRVEKFYLFFPPAIFKYKPKNSDTEFGVGCVPLGGFCKISGMIDESMDKDTMAQAPQAWEFRTKPAWQRLLVMFGGVFFNFLLAILIYSGVSYAWGEEYLKTENAKYGIEVNDLSYEIGFRNGDKIISIDGNPAPENFSLLQYEIVKTQAKKVGIIRNGKKIFVTINPVYIPAMLNTKGMFNLATPIAIASLPDSSININAGLMPGDKFVSIENSPVGFFSELQNTLNMYRGIEVIGKFARGNDTISIPLQVSNTGKLEVILQPDLSSLDITTKKYSLIESIGVGANKTVTTITNYIAELGLIFSPKTEAYKSVGSFIAIGSIFPGKWNWEAFWYLSAWLSVMLAVLNLLPIPALDGGHILFTLYEIITRRKPSEKFLEYAQIIGMILLLSLVLLAFGNDIYKLFN